MKTLGVPASLVLLMCTLLLADASGKWSGTLVATRDNGETEEDTVFMELKQSGTEISGTAGPNEQELHTIENGKIEGDKITFEVRPGENNLFKVVLTLTEGRLVGEATNEREGRIRKAKLDLTKKAVQ